VASSLSERAHSLQTLKTQIAVMMATWQSEFRGNLSKVIDRIDTAGQTEDYWRIVRRQVELAQPDFVEHVAKHSKILTTTESKICLLIGLNLSSPEIASVLNISDRTVSNYRSRIRKKLSATETRFARLFQAPAA
jgi:DNA-binding NarL/FixJ family response regulator